MNTRTKVQHPPLIGSTMAGVAFFIHVALCVINFNFTAMMNEIPMHQTNINMLMFSILQPVAVAGLIAPVIVVARHSSFLIEFRTTLFVAVGCFVVYNLAEMAGMMS